MSNWYPSLFEKEGRKQQFDDEYLSVALNYGRRLFSEGFPVVFTLAHLANLTGCSFDQLRSIVSRDTDPYRQFNIKKRAGGFRQIVVPEPHLLRAQRWIHDNILTQCNVHPCAYGYVKGRGIKQNAVVHCGSNWLIKVDIQRFFESISERQVFRVFKNIGYTNLLSFEFSRLCTRPFHRSRKEKSKRWTNKQPDYKFYNCHQIGNLPQGAPTSPVLSNLVFYNLDELISKIALRYGCTYTRYSDDLTFSAVSLTRDAAKSLISELSNILSQNGFRRHSSKTHIIPPGARKIITGLTVNDDEPKLTKEFRENIENHLYFIKRYGLSGHCERRGFKSLIGFKHHLQGLIAFAFSIDEKVGSKYYYEFDTIEWPEGI